MPVEDHLNLERTISQPYRERMRARLMPLITEDLIVEHRCSPVGQHSDALRRILTYFGNTEMEGKLIIEHDGNEQWFVCRLHNVPAVRADRIDGPFASEADALHAVFVQRLSEVFDVAVGDRRP